MGRQKTTTLPSGSYLCYTVYVVKLKSPLISLNARGTLSKAITFVRRRRQNIAEEKPEPFDARTAFQLSWRHMFLKAVALWNALSAAEQRTWESAARPHHMTGYAWFVSQALRPNPGLYLPLQGGTMTGDIDMDKNRILKLPAPVDLQEAFRLSDYATYVLPYLLREGARVYNNIDQAVPNGAWKVLGFNSEVYDTDNIHDNVVNNSRLTCRTAGKYIIVFTFAFPAVAGGARNANINLNGVTSIAYFRIGMDAVNNWMATLSAIYDLSVGDYVEARVYQNSGAPINLLYRTHYSAYFMMQRIG